MNVLGAFYSTVISIPLIYFFGTDGVVASLVAVAAAMFVTSWWYSRKIRIRSVPLSLRQFRTETVSLLRLGFIFMISGVLTFGSAYAIRIIVLNENGFHAAGLYQAAWALGGLYAGFVLQAMGTDFYPRLTAVADDDAECNRLINEQTQVSILLAGPGLLLEGFLLLVGEERTGVHRVHGGGEVGEARRQVLASRADGGQDLGLAAGVTHSPEVTRGPGRRVPPERTAARRSGW